MSEFTMGPAILFCPADRPERYAKAAERADAVILDLEDAVAPESKAAAREALLRADLDPARTIVRLNALDSEFFADDLAAVKQTGFRTVMLAKAEDAAAIARELAGFSVVALCETAAGVLNSTAIAAAQNVVALMWGAEDLVASLGGTNSRTSDGGYRAVAQTARSQVLLAAGAHSVTAIDSVYMDIPNTDGLAEEVADALASGFSATACIHPSQVPVIRAGYAPTADEVAHARQLLQAAAEAENGVFKFQGQMVDGPVLRHAEQVLARATA